MQTYFFTCTNLHTIEKTHLQKAKTSSLIISWFFLRYENGDVINITIERAKFFIL